MRSKFKFVLLVVAITTLLATVAVAANEETPLFRERGLGRELNLDTEAFRDRMPRFMGLRMEGLGFYQQLLEKTGLTREEFLELLKSGKSLEEVAKEYDINLEELKEEILNKRLAVIDEMVKEGEITAEEGAAIKERFQEGFGNCDLNSPIMGGFRGGRGFGGCRR